MSPSASGRSSSSEEFDDTSVGRQESEENASEEDAESDDDPQPAVQEALASSADLPDSLSIPLLRTTSAPPGLDWLAKTIRTGVMLYAIYRVAILIRPPKRQQA